MSKPTRERSLADLITIRQNGLRSVNVEQDVNHTAVAEAYTLTPQVRKTLGHMLTDIMHKGARAWTLTGPYGAGKSYFSLFLLNLLSGHLTGHASAMARLRMVDATLAEQIYQYSQLETTTGFLPIPITGYRSTLPECLWQGIERSLRPLLTEPAVATWVAEASKQIPMGNSRTIVNHLQTLTEIVCSLGYRGLLMVLDEMGKPLEYLANHPHSSDIYLLQEIAEFTDRGASYPVLFVGILHQGFERYAYHLDLTTQREWAKVQGRFANVLFQEPASQQMGLLAQVIEWQNKEAFTAVSELMAGYTAETVSTGWRPPLMAEADFTALCPRAYPLHPTSLVILPHLFRRLAQNERSLFSYLGSLEPFGFQAFLQGHTLGAVIRLPDLFDYVVANFQWQMYAKMKGRVINETVERLQSATNLSPLATAVLKTISLINWLAEITDLPPTKAALVAALRSPEVDRPHIESALAELTQKSVVTFRRFNQSYVVWQGSDVDIEERLQTAEKQLDSLIRLAQIVQNHLPPRPIVPRRHSYETGTMRFWQMRYIDSPTDVPPATPDYAGVILLGLPQTRAAYDEFVSWATHPTLWGNAPHVVIGLARETEHMGQLAQTLRRLHWVQENTPELRDDPVARRELRTRIHTIELLLRSEIETTLSAQQLSKGNGCRWFYKGEEQTTAFGRGLSYWLSTLSDDLFKHSPRLWNELVNRRVLTSQGAAARRNLIEAMWLRHNQPQLDIQGYPPERSMYESVLKTSGLHQQDSAGQWKFAPPSVSADEADPLNLHHVWQTIEAWIFDQDPRQHTIQQLYNQLALPPYGLTEGVLPLLLCAFILAYPHETTLYREGSLLPTPSVADWEVLLRRPELFSVVGIRVEGERAVIVARLAQSLGTATAVLPIVRTLITQLRTLPDYAWRTQQLTPTTLALRHTIEKAHSPERLLFHDLPLALEISPFTTQPDTNIAQIDAFFDALNQALQELAGALPTVIQTARDQLLTACGFSLGSEGWEAFRQEATALLPYVNHPNLLPLLKRAAENSDPDAALESVLAFIANRPPRSWYDRDVERFADSIIPLANLFNDERRGYDPLVHLAPEEKVTSLQLADKLLQYVTQESINGDMNNAVVQAAVRVVLKHWNEQT
jgi:hypothetical protein